MIRGAVAALCVLAFARFAHAEPTAIPGTHAVVDVPATWKRVDKPTIVAGYRRDRAVLAITRARVPNIDAWRTKTRDAHLDDIERGLAASVRGYKRIARKLTHAGEVPVLDIEARGSDGTTRLVRVLLFRTYALALAIELPRGAPNKDARMIVASFVPAPPSAPAASP